MHRPAFSGNPRLTSLIFTEDSKPKIRLDASNPFDEWLAGTILPMVQQKFATNGRTVILNTVQMEKVCKDYVDDQVHRLRDTDPLIAQNERAVIMGFSGSGKSSPKSFHFFQTNQGTTLILHGHA